MSTLPLLIAIAVLLFPWLKPRPVGEGLVPGVLESSFAVLGLVAGGGLALLLLGGTSHVGLLSWFAAIGGGISLTVGLAISQVRSQAQRPLRPQRN